MTKHKKGKELYEKYSFLENLLGWSNFKRIDIKIIQQYDIKAFGTGLFSDVKNQEKYFLPTKEEVTTTQQ